MNTVKKWILRWWRRRAWVDYDEDLESYDIRCYEA